MRVFLDSSPVIYLIEWHSQFGPKTANWIAAHATELIASEITRVETLIVPVRVNDPIRIQDFEMFFAKRVSQLATFDRVIFNRAIEIRAGFGFKLIDSLQLAIAVESGCDIFLTNDHRLQRFTGIRIEVI